MWFHSRQVEKQWRTYEEQSKSVKTLDTLYKQRLLMLGSIESCANFFRVSRQIYWILPFCPEVMKMRQAELFEKWIFQTWTFKIYKTCHFLTSPTMSIERAFFFANPNFGCNFKLEDVNFSSHASETLRLFARREKCFDRGIKDAFNDFLLPDPDTWHISRLLVEIAE